MLLSPCGVELGPELNATKNTKDIKKCFQQKLFIIKFPTKKLSERKSLFPPVVEVGASKDCHL